MRTRFMSAFVCWARCFYFVSILTTACGLFAFGLCGGAQAQQANQVATAQSPLITQPVDESQWTTLRGNTHPLARPQFDLGAASADLALHRMLLVLKRSPGQEAVLRKLLDDQQDKNSPNYHKWLKTGEFYHRFGPSEGEKKAISDWLTGEGFTVEKVNSGYIAFSGTIDQAQRTFAVKIARFGSGEAFGNTSDPFIPAQFASTISAVTGMDNMVRAMPASDCAICTAPTMSRRRAGAYILTNCPGTSPSTVMPVATSVDSVIGRPASCAAAMVSNSCGGKPCGPTGWTRMTTSPPQGRLGSHGLVPSSP